MKPKEALHFLFICGRQRQPTADRRAASNHL